MEFKKNNIKIIILSGKSQSGKSEIANYIVKTNEKAISLAYASYLKEYAKNILNWDGCENTKPRDFLQQLGVELIKTKIDKNMLINRIKQDIEIYSYFYNLIIISDARFKEEITNIKNEFNNVTVIKIVGKENNLTKEQKQHITETSLDDYNDYDYIINNTQSKKILYENIDKIMKEIL